MLVCVAMNASLSAEPDWWGWQVGCWLIPITHNTKSQAKLAPPSSGHQVILSLSSNQMGNCLKHQKTHTEGELLVWELT